MESLSKNWNTDENYWVLHPQLKTVKLFKDLYSSDKSKKKIKSSKLMWAIALYIDPNDQNVWRNTNDKDKKELIATDYLEDSKFNWEDKLTQELIEEYKSRCLTIPEKELVRLLTKLEQRGKFLDSTNYSLDAYKEDSKGKITLVKGTADQLDKMMASTGKIYDHLLKIQQTISDEASLKTRLRGDEVESATDAGMI